MDDDTRRLICRVKCLEEVTRKETQKPDNRVVYITEWMAMERPRWLVHFCGSPISIVQVEEALRLMPQQPRSVPR
jgi:hypothetical protein